MRNKCAHCLAVQRLPQFWAEVTPSPLLLYSQHLRVDLWGMFHCSAHLLHHRQNREALGLQASHCWQSQSRQPIKWRLLPLHFTPGSHKHPLEGKGEKPRKSAQLGAGAVSQHFKPPPPWNTHIRVLVRVLATPLCSSLVTGLGCSEQRPRYWRCCHPCGETQTEFLCGFSWPKSAAAANWSKHQRMLFILKASTNTSPLL